MYEPDEDIDEDEDEEIIDDKTKIAALIGGGSVAIAIGLGYLFNPGVGWIFIGVLLIAVVVTNSLTAKGQIQ